MVRFVASRPEYITHYLHVYPFYSLGISTCTVLARIISTCKAVLAWEFLHVPPWPKQFYTYSPGLNSFTHTVLA